MRVDQMTRTDRDTLLVAAAQAGDREAFEDLVRRNARAAARLAGRLLGNPEDAEDVVQESFTRAYQSLAAFRGDASFRTWVLQITLNISHDHLRRRQRRRSEETDLLRQLDLAPCRTPGPQRRATARDEVSVLNEAVADLPARQKAALLLKVYEGLSYTEVAEVLGTTIGAARVYLALARQSLRKRFERRARLSREEP